MRSDDDGDAGRTLEPLTSAREFAVQPAHEPEPIAPFASPFIDLLGCRIRQPMALKLQGPNLELAEPATVYEHQLVQFNWTIDEALARRANYFGLTVVSESAGSRQPVWQIVGIAGSERSVGYGRANQRREDAIERAALHLSPGTYLVTLAAWDGSRPPSAPGVPIAQTKAILQVGPMPDGFITFYDI
ncbi:MAG TPA: hypothetical protein VNL70_05120, partial [Tepidisphaeraceae bacterium]|nr:hypothetical protein [Tepidisphaeraceae bacterium]